MRGLLIASVIVAALLSIEWAARLELMPGTSDLGSKFTERARELADASHPRIAIVGNSVSDRIRPDIVESEWRALTGHDARVEKFITYYSNLATWHRLSAQFFWKQGRKPDLLVITYHEGNTLADSTANDVGNLARYFTGPEDRRSLFARDLRTPVERIEYLLSSVSDAFATRDRIRDAFLHVIPGYHRYATNTNAVEFEHEKQQTKFEPHVRRSFRSLSGFLADARRAGVTICFVASPSRPTTGQASYRINARAMRMIADNGMLSIDLRHFGGVSADMYSDNVHLNGKGSPIYTRELTREIHAAWKQQ